MNAATSPSIRRLRLTDFRSYARLDLNISGRLVALAGANGSGKTNILEALSFLGPGRGLRRALGSALPRKGGSGGYSILADAEIDGAAILLATAVQSGEATRLCRIDREPVAGASRFLDHLSLLWLTPDQDGLFRGSAGDRRRFLDRLVLAIDPAHAPRASAYENAMRQRNRLLEDERGDGRWLEAIEREMAELGTALAAARRETVLRLADLAARDADAVAPFPFAMLRLEGDVEGKLETCSALETEDWFRSALRENRWRDRQAGRALVGPQMSDLAVIHGPKREVAALCSTGEQKALLIGLVIAQARLIRQMRGAAPILLLDEIAAHLDEARRAALFVMLDALGGQAFMTGTDHALFSALPTTGSCYDVAEGSVRLAVSSAMPVL
ncbi:RecF Recombinational DNA repair ATPase (RecF pathway) [Rhabdaerophilaceae bacterium]